MEYSQKIVEHLMPLPAKTKEVFRFTAGERRRQTLTGRSEHHICRSQDYHDL